ncbi:hypothetical protein GCM10027610_009050 [Dactylosporangium cerinum]
MATWTTSHMDNHSTPSICERRQEIAVWAPAIPSPAIDKFTFRHDRCGRDPETRKGDLAGAVRHDRGKVAGAARAQKPGVADQTEGDEP